MVKGLLSLAAFGAFGAGASALEAWLDRRGFDRVSILLLCVVSGSMIVLVVLLAVHFWR